MKIIQDKVIIKQKYTILSNIM